MAGRGGSADAHCAIGRRHAEEALANSWVDANWLPNQALEPTPTLDGILPRAPRLNAKSLAGLTDDDFEAIQEGTT